MDRNVIYVLGAVGALAGAGPANAAAAALDAPSSGAASYADLLQPIPNAVAVLRAEDAAALAAAPDAGAPVVENVQFIPHHHHHHHYRRYHRRYYHHHHHPYG